MYTHFLRDGIVTTDLFLRQALTTSSVVFRIDRQEEISRIQ